MELLPVEVPRARFVGALRGLLGRAWGEVTDGEHVTCIGLPLLALLRVGLLAPDCDVNLSFVPPARRFAVLMALLRKNARQMPVCFDGLESDELRPGDFVLSCWRDTDARQTLVHHVAIWTSPEPAPFGSQIQSLSREHGGAGRVYEAPMSILDWSRVESVWRLNALTDEPKMDGEQ